MSRKKILIFIVIGTATILAIDIVPKIIRDSRALRLKTNNVLEPPKDYDDLFKTDVLDSLIFASNLEVEGKPSITSYTYKRTFIQMECLKTDSGLTIQRLFYPIERKSVSKIDSDVYTVTCDDLFQSLSLCAKSPTVNKLHFTVFADTFYTTINNDSTLGIVARANNFSLRFNNLSSFDFYARAKSETSDDRFVPVNFLFIKRNGRIYFLYQCSTNKKERLNPFLLYNLIKS